MRVLKNEITEDYHEIEVEYHRLFISWKIKYRKIDNAIFRFKDPDKYFETSVFEHYHVINLFKIKPITP